MLGHTDKLCKLIRDTPLTLKSWDRQKKIFASYEDQDDLALGFATFFLNRTNRSGILNGGVIGGRDQTGPWKIDARFNRAELTGRIEAIAKMKRRILLSRMDALKFLETQSRNWPVKTLIYLDPPYYAKGRDLYYDFYQHEDHERVERFVTGNLAHHKWIVSYDNVPAIRALYSGYQQIVYGIGYSARTIREGSEIMFFSDTLRTAPLVGPFRFIRSAQRRSDMGQARSRLAVPKAKRATARQAKTKAKTRTKDRASE